MTAPYGCNTQGAGPRGRATGSWMQDGWKMQFDGVEATRTPVMVWIETTWGINGKVIRCGRLDQAGLPDDPKWAGCENWGRSEAGNAGA